MDDVSGMQKTAQAVATMIDFGRNFPPPSPVVEQGLSAAFAHLTKTDIASSIRFPRFAGTENDRRAGAVWLARRFGTTPDAERIILANGSQSLLAMLMAHYVKPGGTLLTEVLTYPAIKPLAALFGVRLHGVAMDDEGIMPDSLDEECRRLHGNARALYCMPTLHNPTSTTMSEPRREAIARISRRHDLAIFEDDIYGVLPMDAPPPLSVFAPERSWYVLGLSKSLASQLRVAYVLAPNKALGEAVYWPGVRTTNWMVAPLIAEIASHWLSCGLASEILETVRAETVSRKRLASALLRDTSIDPQALNYHLWLDVPSGVSLSQFLASLRNVGVVVGAGDSFAVDSDLGDRKFRIGLGVPPDQFTLATGLDSVAALFARKE